MWEQYGHDGVAICSRYELLKSALEGFVDKAQLGLIRYGTDHLANRFNAIDFITTKQEQYRLEAEVRVGDSSRSTGGWQPSYRSEQFSPPGAA